MLRPRESNANAFKLYGSNKPVKEVAGKHKGVVGTGVDRISHTHLKELGANRLFHFFNRDQKFKCYVKKNVTKYFLAFKILAINITLKRERPKPYKPNKT